jgi:hypothetical protein
VAIKIKERRNFLKIPKFDSAKKFLNSLLIGYRSAKNLLNDENFQAAIFKRIKHFRIQRLRQRCKTVRRKNMENFHYSTHQTILENTPLRRARLAG